jgi:hypothetical protein
MSGTFHLLKCVAFVKERHSGGPGPLWCGSRLSSGNRWEVGRTAWRVPAHPPFLNKIKGDQELENWRQETRSYILDALKNPEVSEKNVDKVKGLLREGRRILQKYRSSIDVLYDDQVKLAQAVKDDPTLQDFNRKLRNLGSHLALNEKGEVDPAKLQESMLQIINLLGNMFHSYLAKLPLTKVDI